MKALALLRDLSLLKCGWHRTENPETKAVAMFPNAAIDDSDWEQRCLAMHDGQDIVTLPPKPEVPGIRRIMRGD